MRISVLCSDSGHPIYPRLLQWCAARRPAHTVELAQGRAQLSGGEMLFLISCNEVIDADTRARYRASLVIHASDLPQGRGWSPLVWQILAGCADIPVTLLEAGDKVDSGAIWHQIRLHFAGHELVDEINAALFDAELALMDFAIAHLDTIQPRTQAGEPSYYRKRTPEDSRLDVQRSIAEQFNLLRVADADRYPAFFDYLGHRYEITLRKVEPHES
ncbi:MAG: UDP-glucuronic acid dehydrogenase [Hydrogenophilales bacterium 28-61-23]|nr:MAG: UDP-glucuronic acid dehydrogenase [Hydrogenophilales bacterium 28-61-23]